MLLFQGDDERERERGLKVRVFERRRKGELKV